MAEQVSKSLRQQSDPICTRCGHPKSAHLPGPPDLPQIAGMHGATEDAPPGPCGSAFTTREFPSRASDQRDLLIERAAQMLYDEWRHQYPGAVEGTSQHPRWFALRDDLKDEWREAVRRAFAQAESRRAERVG